MARLVEGTHCPHCGAELPSPKPLVCPACAGSLRQRHLKAGCLSSAPKLVLFATAAWWLARELSREWS
jgi:predicted amidophosphoribosyltransferase